MNPDILPHLVGLPKANELMLTGRLIKGDEAADLGLANYACESAEAVLAKAFPGLFGADEKLTSKEETAYPVEAPSSPRRRSSSGKLMDAMNPFKRRGSKGQ